MRSMTLRAFSLAQTAMATHDRRFGWYTASTPVPNGRFLIDHDAVRVWFDPRLDGEAFFEAFGEAVRELMTGTADATVLPFVPRRVLPVGAGM